MDYRDIGGGYSVSHDGNVFSSRLGQNLKPVMAAGYRHVSISRDGKKRRVWKIARLVCEAFHGPKPFPNAMVRHLNDLKADDRRENLAWGSKSDNSKDAVRNGICSAASNAKKSAHKRAGDLNPRSRLNWDQVSEIRRRRAAGERGKDLAQEFGVSQMCVSSIHHGTRWKEEHRHG